MPEATVFLIDDDGDVRDAVSRLLRSEGWNVETYATADGFLGRGDYADTGCVLLDISMPGMTGPQLHGWMRENGVSLPVIFLSGHCDVPTSVQAMKQGAVDVLEKPADAEVLVAAIAQAVDRHREYSSGASRTTTSRPGLPACPAGSARCWTGCCWGA
jgi:FixJ family two-component response regulator